MSMADMRRVVLFSLLDELYKQTDWKATKLTKPTNTGGPGRESDPSHSHMDTAQNSSHWWDTFYKSGAVLSV